MFSLQKLGVITGVGRNAFNTTFGDMGALERDSHLRAAYAHIEPTTIDFLAACLTGQGHFNTFDLNISLCLNGNRLRPFFVRKDKGKRI